MFDDNHSEIKLFSCSHFAHFLPLQCYSVDELTPFDIAPLYFETDLTSSNS